MAGRTRDAPDTSRKIKIGLINACGRGAWISGLFQEHGGNQFHAVADYFQEEADKGGGAREFDGSEDEATAVPLPSGSCTFHDGVTLLYSRGNSTAGPSSSTSVPPR
ncbi:MAG: hypothetical protein MUF04_05445 [Akkermansiaceae bacterium]|jgi:hypothetical protein|nr:hypothetical protein [Akkermansiaceae bacterium]